MKKYLGLFTAAFLGGIVAISSTNYFNPTLSDSETPQKSEYVVPSQFTSLNSETPEGYVDLSLAAEQTVQEVVHVKVRQEGQEMIQYDPMEYYFKGYSEGRKYKAPDKQGSGSGVVIREDGYIVTNNHVVEGADEIEVVFNNNETYTAELIGLDPSTDLALLKIEANGLKSIPIGNSDDLRLGEWVLAVGNPYNLNSTVTAGIVSAKARSINILQTKNGTPPLEAFIQTDAAVNPGNSGGALVNARGELIGINSAIKSPTGSYSGYSFAIPVNIMKKVVTDILEYGVVQRAFIGVSIRNIDNDLAIKQELSQLTGVYINDVMDNGAAKDAGLQPGDIVTRVNNVSVNTVAELQSQIGLYNPGDEVSILVNREGKEQLFKMTLRNKSGNTDIVEASSGKLDRLGAEFADAPTELLSQLGIKSGVSVRGIHNGAIAKSGIKEGFIITHLDHQPIKDAQQLKAVMLEKKNGILISGIYPNGYKRHYGVGLE